MKNVILAIVTAAATVLSTVSQADAVDFEWVDESIVDDFTDELTGFIVLWPEGSSLDSPLMDNPGVRFVMIACPSEELMVSIQTDEYLGRDTTSPVLYRIDDEEPRQTIMHTKKNVLVSFSNGLAEELVRAKKLRFKIEDYSGDSTTSVINVANDGVEILKPFAEKCK